jgi:hypothetical protein
LSNIFNLDNAVEKIAKIAGSLYEMLPHTEEDAEVFTRFVPAFEA